MSFSQSHCGGERENEEGYCFDPVLMRLACLSVGRGNAPSALMLLLFRVGRGNAPLRRAREDFSAMLLQSNLVVSRLQLEA